MNTENDNVHLPLRGMLAALVFCVAGAVFFHHARYHEPPTAVISVPPADCLPNGSGGPCIPFDQIQKMMRSDSDASDPIPANPAAANEDTI